jgi:cytochrome c-type biogenesis protein
VDTAVLSLALVAGGVAAFNPCGFALLPAYLTLLVTSGEAAGAAGGSTAQRGTAAAVLRAARFTAGMTTGFVAVFGGFALAVVPLATSVERWLPVLTLVMGVALVAAGAWLLSGRELRVGLPGRRGTAPGSSWASQVGYGVTFALASLSCTLAPFLAVTAGALRGGEPLGVVAAFLAYALGMGAVVGVLALSVATAGTSVTARLRRVAAYVPRAAGVLLVVAGGYVAWYGWFELRVLAGSAVSDPVVRAAVAVQGAITREVAGLGATGLALAAAALAAVLAAVAASAAARRRRADTRSGSQEVLR